MLQERIPTKDKIFRSAVSLFAEKGCHGTSMRELAADVGIKESSVYNHFKGKEAIFNAILDYQLEGFQAAMAAIERSKMEIDNITDPVEFWLAGAKVFVGNLPPLTEKVSRIIINEMYLNRNCREFYLKKLRPIQKKLTVTILNAMVEKKLIRPCPLELTAEQYVYLLEGMRIEHNLRLMEGGSQDEMNRKMFKHLSLFIERLK